MRKSLAALTGGCASLHERRYPGSAPGSRTETGRDRDRVLYSSAFLRLGNVTQVASAEAGHTFHSRLTHSLKVAQVARRVSEHLQGLGNHTGPAREAIDALDADAAETCALAHDLGHPPFGHLAEQELNAQASNFGGFEGNAQSFRILTRLSVRAESERGLNLTRQSLNGVLKYPWLRHPEEPAKADKWGAYDADRDYFAWVRGGSDGDAASLEARIMDWSDDVTYAVHDLDDFFRAGLIPLEDLCREGDEQARFKQYLDGAEHEAAEVAGQLFAGLGITARYQGRLDQRAQLRAAGSFLIDRYINAFSVVSDNGGAWVEIDDEAYAQVAVLKRLIWFYIIERPSLAVLQTGQRTVIRELVTMFMRAVEDERERSLLGPVYGERLDDAKTDDARRRVVIDLVAGLTEESAIELYRRHIGMAVGSVLSAPRL